jgi:hypothetical protein
MSPNIASKRISSPEIAGQELHAIELVEDTEGEVAPNRSVDLVDLG